jgi:hypothetical protein
LKLDQIYSSDVSGICWEVFPVRTVVLEREKRAIGISSDKHLTVMGCGNVSKNHKLRLVVIGGARKRKKIAQGY